MLNFWGGELDLGAGKKGRAWMVLGALHIWHKITRRRGKGRKGLLDSSNLIEKV